MPPRLAVWMPSGLEGIAVLGLHSSIFLVCRQAASELSTPFGILAIRLVVNTCILKMNKKLLKNVWLNEKRESGEEFLILKALFPQRLHDEHLPKYYSQ